MAQSRYIARDQSLRRFVLNEPRGGVSRHVNLLVPPKNPAAQMGFIIMEPEDTPPMSGSNTICVATVLLDTGIVPMTEPETKLVLEAPGGLVEVVVFCRNGKAERIRSGMCRALPIGWAPARGRGSRDTDGRHRLWRRQFRHRRRRSARLPHRAGRSEGPGRDGGEDHQGGQRAGFVHPTNLDWDHISFCQFAAPLTRAGGVLTGANAVVIQPGKIDRSPTGTGCSARMAVLRAHGGMQVGEHYIARSIIGSEFHCRIEAETMLGDRAAIIPSVSGRAWITGMRQEMLDPDDPWPAGYKVSDTWPGAGR